MLSVFFLAFFEDFFGVSETEPDGEFVAVLVLEPPSLLKKVREQTFNSRSAFLKLYWFKITRVQTYPSPKAESADVVEEVLSAALDMLQ